MNVVVARKKRQVVGTVAILAALLLASMVMLMVADPARTAPTDCQVTTVTAFSEADAWISEKNNTSNTGSDSVLNVAASLSSGNSRSLVRFRLPSGVPSGCVVESARLRLYTPKGSEGARVEAMGLASSWAEGSVTWSNQPGTTGPAAMAWSTDGYLRWNVTSQVQAIYDTNANHGFLIRDPAEGTDTGALHGFHSKEKGENPPELVIRFAAPPTGEEPAPPAPPVPAAVRCGEVLTQSTLVTNDLSGCLGDGLVIGAPRIIVDLDGHTIDGVGLGTGIHNDGYASVSVRNGTVQDFDYGVRLLPESSRNDVELLTLRLNQVAAIELFDAADNRIRGNTLDQNGGGIDLVNGTTGAVVAGNTITANGGAGLLLRDSDANRLEDNSVVGGGDLGIELAHASGNTVLGNTVSRNSDGGIELSAGAHGNRIEGNTLSESGDSGILVSGSDRNQLINNTSHLMSDSGIGLNGANDSVVRGNDVRFNSGGIGVDGSRNLIEANNASETTGTGIELGTGAFENHVVGNTANANSQGGIYLEGEAGPGLGNLIERNTTSANQVDGILAAKGGHTITANVARDNRGWGISALNSIDGGGNVASGNGAPQQCVGVVCSRDMDPPPPDPSDPEAPDTTITDGAAAGDGTASFRFTGSDNKTAAANLMFECRLDGQDWVSCASPHSYANLGSEPHTFEVRAIDEAGNVDPTPASHSWTEGSDTVPPDTTIDSGPDAETTSTIARFTFSASEPNSIAECSLDGAPFEACTSPREYTNLAVGDHEFRVRATDPAGNADPTPANYSWRISPPPTCDAQAITSGANADSWIHQKDGSKNFGTDSVLKVNPKSGENTRALVRFNLPTVPDGCQVASAELRLHSGSSKAGRTIEARQLAGSWTESGVTWNNQPATTGTAAIAPTPSSSGMMKWSVTAQVQGMYSSGNHGFLIRDASEGSGDAEQSFNSREKGTDRPPELVITFG